MEEAKQHVLDLLEEYTRRYGVDDTLALLDRWLTSHSSGDAQNVCGNGAHRVLGASCEVPGCGEKRTGKSRYCKKHAMRVKRHGSPETTLRPWDKRKEKVV